MAISVDTVYQRVLALANKEQRGYITPLEFNLLANQAQMDVFEQYFYDKNQNERLPGNETDYSDVVDILNEKISMFEIAGTILNGTTLPTDLYRLGVVTSTDGHEIERVDARDFTYITSSPLTRPTNRRPIYKRSNQVIAAYNSNGLINTDIFCTYIKEPSKVAWGYVVSGTQMKALYNPTTSVDFEHHRSDETEMVMKILELAGVTINKPEIVQIAGQEDIQKIQQEKR